VLPLLLLTRELTIYVWRQNADKDIPAGLADRGPQGDTFHQNDHPAASNKLPLGTTAKVTNLKTGKSTH